MKRALMVILLAGACIVIWILSAGTDEAHLYFSVSGPRPAAIAIAPGRCEPISARYDQTSNVTLTECTAPVGRIMAVVRCADTSLPLATQERVMPIGSSHAVIFSEPCSSTKAEIEEANADKTSGVWAPARLREARGTNTNSDGASRGQ